MGRRRSLIDRVLRLGVPRPVPDVTPPPYEIAADLFGLDRELRFLGGLRMPSRTTVVRLRDRSLVVLVAPPLVEAAAPGLDALGEVRTVVAPNSFHFVYAADFLRAYPNAQLLVAPGLPERVPQLPPARELSADPPAAWAGQLDYTLFPVVRGVTEVIFFHIPTGTLILTDLAFHMVRLRRFDRVGWRLFGIPGRFGPSRTARLLLLRDREAVAPCLDRVAQWPIKRIVVAHGDIIENDAAVRFREAFASYLPSRHRLPAATGGS